ncbi:MAG: hypothetical protein WB625_10970 [Candidatus Sulfotelmatobacter sp.]
MTIAEAPIKCVTCAMLNDDGKPVHEECYVPKAKAEHKVIFELPVIRARQILNSQSKWNRADTRVCPADARTFSLYCALEKATDEVSGKFEHRGAAMQEAR